MKTKLKLSTLLFAMIAFMAISCGQSQKSEVTEESTEAMEGHDHEEGNHDHSANGQHDGSESDNNEMTTAYASINDEQATGILNAYLELKDALVKSSSEVAQNAAEEIKNILSGNTDSKVLSGILEDANHIVETDKMDHIREHFDLMSQNVYEMVKVKNTGKTVYKQFCPMAFDNEGAFWLSSEEEIRNPYFGDKMLKCGKVQETVASK